MRSNASSGGSTVRPTGSSEFEATDTTPTVSVPRPRLVAVATDLKLVAQSVAALDRAHEPEAVQRIVGELVNPLPARRPTTAVGARLARCPPAGNR